MADFAWEVLLLDALGIDDPDHADGPSDLLPLVRWAVEDARRYRNALHSIRRVIERIGDTDWEDGYHEDHPLWRALDQIDGLVSLAHNVHPLACRCPGCNVCRPEFGHHVTPHRGCVLR